MRSKAFSKNTISLELESLNRLSSAITSDLSLDKVLDITVKELKRIFKIKICGIFLPDENGILKLIKYCGANKTFQTFFNQNVTPQINKSIFKMLGPRYTNDVLGFYKDNSFLHTLVKLGKFRKEMSVPLKLKKETIGVLNVGRYANEKDFTAQDLALVKIFANHVAIVINNAKLYGKLINHARALEEQNKDLNTILKISQATSRILDLDKVLQAATEKIAKALKVGRCTATLGTPLEGIGILRGIYSTVKNEPLKVGTKFSLDNLSFLNKAIKRKEYFFALNINNYPVTGYLKQHFKKTKSVLFIPFVAGKQISGVFTISSLNKPRVFSPGEIKLAQTIANQVAVAIENARLMDLVKQHSRRLSLLSSKIIKTQEEERKRIAEQLHDQIGQTLTAMKMNLEMISRSLSNGSKRIKARVLDTQQLLTETLEDVRYLTSDLRPTMLDDFGLVPTLRWYGQSFSKRFNIKFHLTENIVGRLSSEIETLLYRITQEGLTNVAKHSKAKNVWVDLFFENSNVYINIKDNGIGFDAEKLFNGDLTKNSFGLISMRERVELLGGEFCIKSKINNGTRITIKIPRIECQK